uniref:Uncharacterized protein n=1 Tax=Falco tinnunculus TaxID=100819 RepID=A0A8C4UIQ5_FALTI
MSSQCVRAQRCLWCHSYASRCWDKAPRTKQVDHPCVYMPVGLHLCFVFYREKSKQAAPC